MFYLVSEVLPNCQMAMEMFKTDSILLQSNVSITTLLDVSGLASGCICNYAKPDNWK